MHAFKLSCITSYGPRLGTCEGSEASLSLQNAPDVQKCTRLALCRGRTHCSGNHQASALLMINFVSTAQESGTPFKKKRKGGRGGGGGGGGGMEQRAHLQQQLRNCHRLCRQ